MNTEQWEELARKRLQSILRTQTVSTWRTLEHKISDAGPNDQRAQPHILTRARAQLEHTGMIVRLDRSGGPWYTQYGTFGFETLKNTLRLALRLWKMIPRVFG